MNDQTTPIQTEFYDYLPSCAVGLYQHRHVREHSSPWRVPVDVIISWPLLRKLLPMISSLTSNFGRKILDQIIMVKSKSIWSDQNNFGHIEGQGINLNWIKSYNIILANNIFFHAWNASFQGYFTEVSFGTSHSGPTLVA